MGVNTILTHSGRGDQSVEVRSVNPVVMRASTILFKDYDTWQKYRKLRATDRVLSYGARGTTTNFELEKLICELEGGYRAQLFPTGLAALAMVLLNYADYLKMHWCPIQLSTRCIRPADIPILPLMCSLN